MTRIENIRDFLAQKRFAFIGVSRQPKDFSRALFREFKTRDYEPVPVHPEAAEIEGARCFAHLRDIQPPVESVLLMTSPTVTNLLVRECVEAGIKRVWFYRGAWEEWEIEQIDMAVPISPEELERKRSAIFKHQTQKDGTMLLGGDIREVWERAEERNRGTARLYDALGMAEYEAIEAFKHFRP